jgi:putative membrane fusion protein
MNAVHTRPEKSGPVKSPAMKIIPAAVGLFILYIVAVQAWHLTRVRLAGTAFLGTGELNKVFTAEGVLVRDEAVITSPAAGLLVMLVKEGERVRAGDSIAEVKTESGEPGIYTRSALISAPGSGLVSSRLDGLEGVLNPAQVNIPEAAGSGLKGKGAGNGIRQDNKCEKGQPVIKIIDNLSPQIICLQAPEGFPADKIKEDGSIAVLWNSIKFTCRITDVRNHAGGSQLVLQTYNLPPGLFNVRQASFELVGGTVSGCIVPAKSLAAKDGRQGLYIMDKQGIRWVPAEVEGIVNQKAAISGDLIVPGTRYVVNPRWLLFGNRVIEWTG